MTYHYADAIVVLAHSLTAAKAIQDVIHLRGFDQVVCATIANGAAAITQFRPDLLVVAPGTETEAANQIIAELKPLIPVIYVVDAFNEEAFIAAFDAGARDYLVQPVHDTYLISRILIALQAQRQRQHLNQRNRVLKTLGGIGEYSNVFTTAHFMQLLKDEAQRLDRDNKPNLSLLAVEVQHHNPDKKAQFAFHQTLYRDIGRLLMETCRGGDIVGEYFEDKFMVLFPHTSLKGAQNAQNRVIEKLTRYAQRMANTPNRLHLATGSADYSNCLHYEDLLNKTIEALKDDKTAQTSDPS